MCPIAGGNWNNGAAAGVWALNLNNVRGNSNDNVGCRADSAKPRSLQHGHGGAKGDAFRRADVFSSAAKSEHPCISSNYGPADLSTGRERQARDFFTMKRHGHLFELAFSRTALMQAFHDAAKSKRGRRACFVFERSLGAQLAALHQELHSGTYKPRPYFTFTVHEPKTRLIFAPAFRDCVVQHAIYLVISPIFERIFIEQSFACRKGYGTHKAADYAQTALQASPAGSYTLQLDIRKFFYRIDRDILRTLIEKKIKDARMVDLMMAFADYGEPVGIPIGNLLSQLYALIYLNPLDHFCKRELKSLRYCRYVDDFVLFGISRAYATECRQRIIDFIRDELHLELSRSTIAPVARGLNFVGYRTWASKRFIRRRSLWNFRQALKKGKVTSVASILGHARRTHSLQHLITLTKEKYHGIYRQLPKIYQCANHAHTALA